MSKEFRCSDNFNHDCYVSKRCDKIPDIGVDLRIKVDDGDVKREFFIHQRKMMIPGNFLGASANSCHLALRKNIIDGDDKIYIGNIFLKEFYVFLDQKDSGELYVGIGPQNPDDIIGEAHYNWQSNRTDYLPEDRDTD